MYSNIKYLAQSYFHQDFQDEADEPVGVVENFRASEPATTVEALRAEIVALLESGATESDLAALWLDEGGSSYDPDEDGLTTREWLRSVVAVLGGDDAATAEPATDAAAPGGDAATAGSSGIPFKGVTGA